MDSDFCRGDLNEAIPQAPAIVLYCYTDLLGEAEVHNLEVTLPVYEEVLWLEVPVDNVEVVQVLQTAHNLG